ncbi:MAG: S-layer protein [Candidatus Aenigmarchaeota archaeon]|nr:S-layer protein [Candidatus Aenigmarchaeota archaeon]
MQGTYVNLTVSSGKLASFNVYIAGKNSDTDYLGLGGEYMDPVWKTFKLAFPAVTPALDDTTNRNKLAVDPSGDNLLKATITDDKGQSATVTWAYKASSTGAAFSLADSSGYTIHVVENATIANNEYFVIDAGDFSHMFQVSSVNLDSTTSAYIDIRDVFSGTTLRVSTSTDNKDAKVIDGQTYYFTNRSSTTFAVTWGTGAADNNVGTYVTVFPVLKGKLGEKYAFTKANQTVPINVGRIQLPGGAVSIGTNQEGAITKLNLTAVAQEDGTTSACQTTVCASLNMTEAAHTQAFNLSRTSTGGAVYNISADRNGTSINISMASDFDSLGAARATQPGILLLEEKDDSSNVYYAYVAASTETSGSNNVAIPTAPEFTSNEDTDTLGSNSNINRYVDLYGVYAERTTSGQDTVKIWYPDDQTKAEIFVLAEGATTSATTGASAGTVKQAVPVKTSIAKLDTEVTTADKTTKNIILVGGPAVNSLVRELATAAKTKDTQWYLDQGPGTTLVDLVSDAFTTGKSVLVVAGYNADDTRTGTGVLQNYDAHASELASKNRVVWKNGVVSTTAA